MRCSPSPSPCSSWRSARPRTTRHLLQGLAALWPSYLSYAITFLLIGQVWANHHVMFDHIRSPDRMVLFLNTLLLMDIAFLPFSASVLAAAFRTGHGQRTAVVFHGMTFLMAAILFNAIWGYARHEHRLLATTIDAAGPEPSAGASGSPWPGSPPEPCWAPCCPSSAWS
jgi:TMEM175 potassium channel family protein